MDTRDHSVLEEAENIVNGERQKSYGHPAENFGNIATAWTAYLNARRVKVSLTPEDVGMMMVIMKAIRNANRWKRDNLVDIAGYARATEMAHAELQLMRDELDALLDKLVDDNRLEDDDEGDIRVGTVPGGDDKRDMGEHYGGPESDGDAGEGDGPEGGVHSTAPEHDADGRPSA